MTRRSVEPTVVGTGEGQETWAALQVWRESEREENIQILFYKCCYRDNPPKNENSANIYSPSSCCKPVWVPFFY